MAQHIATVKILEVETNPRVLSALLPHTHPRALSDDSLIPYLYSTLKSLGLIRAFLSFNHQRSPKSNWNSKQCGDRWKEGKTDKERQAGKISRSPIL